MRGAQPICPNVCNDGGGAKCRGAEPSAICFRPRGNRSPTKGSYQLSLNKWGTRASRRFAYRGARHRPKLPVQRRHTDVCTPPAGCGKQSRNRARPAGNAHCPNSAKKFNIPVMKRSTGRIQNQSASSIFCACKNKMKEVKCLFLMRGMAGEYPETPGIWEGSSESA